MFTGIVETLGTLKEVETKPAGLRLRIELPFSDLILGESVAVNGVCLTAAALGAGFADFELGSETLRQTRFGLVEGLVPGVKVNLERALQVGARLSGHWVQGHVDELGTYLKRETQGISEMLTFRVPRSGSRYLVKKGSITLDGISLTIADLKDDQDGSEITVQVIPHTWKATHLATLPLGSRINLEYDILAKLALRQAELA